MSALVALNDLSQRYGVSGIMMISSDAKHDQGCRLRQRLYTEWVGYVSHADTPSDRAVTLMSALKVP